MNDARGREYEQLIRGHINSLFPGGHEPAAGSVPSPSGASPGTSASHAKPKPSGPVSAPSKAGSSYTVRRGDALWDIASRLKSRGMTGSHWDIIWMCESCAIPLGPQQGDIDLDDPTTRV